MALWPCDVLCKMLLPHKNTHSFLDIPHTFFFFIQTPISFSPLEAHPSPLPPEQFLLTLKTYSNILVQDIMIL